MPPLRHARARSIAALLALLALSGTATAAPPDEGDCPTVSGGATDAAPGEQPRDAVPVTLREGMVLTIPAAPGIVVDGSRTYTIQSGDTMSEIADRMYGNAERWRDIAEANRTAVPDPQRLKVGVTIVIPQ